MLTVTFKVYDFDGFYFITVDKVNSVSSAIEVLKSWLGNNIQYSIEGGLVA